MNGIFFLTSISKDSNVCFSRPCIISTTKIPKSHSEDPLDLRFVKDSCPGVSMINNPGTCMSNFS